jgi:hypothetical protein
MTDPQRRRHLHEQDLCGFVAVAIVGLVIGLLLLLVPAGPRRAPVRDRWSTAGAAGPLHIMPQISIDGGGDPVHQDAQSRAGPTAPSAGGKVAESDEPGAQPLVAAPSAPGEGAPDGSASELGAAGGGTGRYDAIEMRLPSSADPCFHLVRQVYPLYPADATSVERLIPELTVKVAFFVGGSGAVEGSYVLESDAGPAFAAAVLQAVNSWVYAPDFAACSNPAGFWNVLTVTFRNPQPAYRPVAPEPSEPTEPQ